MLSYCILPMSIHHPHKGSPDVTLLQAERIHWTVHEALLFCCSFGPVRSPGLGRRMEIIGASIMNGYGVLGDDRGCQPSYQVRRYSV